MADTKKREAILDIVVNEGQALKALEEYQKELAKSSAAMKQIAQDYEDEKISAEEANKAILAEKETQKALRKEMQQVEYQLQKTIQRRSEEEGSLKALRGELSNLTAKYDSLSRAERENKDIGGALKKQISEVYNELKNAEEGTGRFQRNVGNYTNKAVGAFQATAGAAGAMINPIANATQAMKVMSKTPVIAILGVLANVLLKVASAMTKSEEQMESMNGVFAIFRGLGDASAKVMEKLGDKVVKVANWLGKAAEKLGLITDAMKEEQEIGKDEIELLKLRRNAVVQNAKDEMEVAKLRTEAEDKVKYSTKKRIEMIAEADEKEKAIADRNLEIAQKELAIARRKAEMRANSTEDNDRLAEAEANLYRVEADYYKKIKELKTKTISLNNDLAKSSKDVGDSEEKAAKKAEEAAEKAYEAHMTIKQKEIETRIKLATKGSIEELNLNKQLLAQKHEQEVHALEQQEGTEELILLKREEYYQALLKLDADYDADVEKIMEDITAKTLEEAEKRFEAQAKFEALTQEAKEQTALAISDSIGSLMSITDAYGEQSEAMAKASKVLALAQIAIETGVATAKGITQSQSVPFPANIAAMASTIATIVGGIASAVSSVKSAKFARGGLVVGEGTATSDSISARLSNGESVMNAKTTSMFAPLLSSLNQMGGGNAIETPTGANTAVLEQAIARGMSGANLKVSVKEIDTVRERMESNKGVADV